jgi:flavin-dependent dehydrogenase
MGGTEVETNYGKPISYGIRRVEFDEFVLSRCDARILQGVSLTTLDRIGDCWVANGEIHARLVIGAGGHFCPVARLLGAASSNDTAVVAQEAEFEMTPAQMRSCSIQPELPELYFCHDMRGYGWCFRKEKYLNIGLGRMDPRSLPMHVAGFLDFLRASGKIGFALPGPMQGHAYLLHGRNRRTIVGERFLLIGDAAGVAYSLSGEGIRPAIESGLLAAETIIAANGQNNVGTLKGYPGLLEGLIGGSGDGWLSFVGSYLPDVAIQALAKGLLANKWITRHVVLDHWFLRTHEPALSSVCTVPS